VQVTADREVENGGGHVEHVRLLVDERADLSGTDLSGGTNSTDTGGFPISGLPLLGCRLAALGHRGRAAGRRTACPARRASR
jgi:hypothetical protein